MLRVNWCNDIDVRNTDCDCNCFVFSKNGTVLTLKNEPSMNSFETSSYRQGNHINYWNGYLLIDFMMLNSLRKGDLVQCTEQNGRMDISTVGMRPRINGGDINFHSWPLNV